MHLRRISLPFWSRVALFAGVGLIASGTGFGIYRYVTRPTVLTVAVGSLDGQATQAAMALGSRLGAANSGFRLKLINAADVSDAARQFADGKADLAVVRADVGDLSQARAIALVNHGVVMLAAPAAMTIERLKGHAVGVVGGAINGKIIEALKTEYGPALDGTVFKDVTLEEAGKALAAKDVVALLLVVPLTPSYLSLIRSVFRPGMPHLVAIGSAEAIADVQRAYESFDLPKGTFRGLPPLPEDDLTTLRVGYYLVANRKIDSSVVANLTQAVMSARRDLGNQQPLLSGMSAPDTDADAFIPVHPGAAAYYNGTQESFMDRYSNQIFLTPMILGALISMIAAAWRFLTPPQLPIADTALSELSDLPSRIRKAVHEAELSAIEADIDRLLDSRLKAAAGGDEPALDIATLNSVALRLDNLIHHRRAVLGGAGRLSS